MRTDDILAFVKENRFCRVHHAAEVTMRNPDSDIHSDDLPSWSAIARLTKDGRLIRVPSTSGYKLDDWVFLPTWKDAPFLREYLDFNDCKAMWDGDEDSSFKSSLARETLFLHPFPEHGPCFAAGRAKEAVLGSVMLECVPASCCRNRGECVFGTNIVYHCAAIPVEERLHRFIMD